MSDEQKIVQEPNVDEEQAPPALPTTEPPKDDVGKPAEPEVTEAPKSEEKPADEASKDEKPASRIFKRPTLKWGKKRDEPSALKEPEQAKDIRDDALGWIAQQIPSAVHKVNYQLLDWAQKLAYEDSSERPELPGKDGSVTRNQFLAHLRDGKLLANLANKLQVTTIFVSHLLVTALTARHNFQMTKVFAILSERLEPGSVVVEPEVIAEEAPAPESEPEKQAEGSAEGEEKKEEAVVEPAKAEEKRATPVQKTQKEKQYDIVNKFTTWANDCLGLGEGKAMTTADLLEKGKAGYPAVFETLWQLAMKAQDKFQQQGIDVEAVVAAASQVVRTNIIQTILNFFKVGCIGHKRCGVAFSACERYFYRRSPPVSDKKDDSTDPAAGDAAPNAPEGEQVIEEECKKSHSNIKADNREESGVRLMETPAEVSQYTIVSADAEYSIGYEKLLDY
uniref:Calponin-homology (CH) domain-containing protein n=1 Tax=Angiostrongylus cantonensis TaxID=6313 RepID=A0A158P8U4_ANGCA